MVTLKSVIAASAIFVGTSSAFWRMECQGLLGNVRLDPLVNPGGVSEHLHAVYGSSGFSATSMFDDLRNGQCTSCRVKQDKSAYWAPALMFQDAATKQFELVPQRGLTAYYFLRDEFGEGGKNIKAFPSGFRMIAGNSKRRTYKLGDPFAPDPPKFAWLGLGQSDQESLSERALGFNCMNYAGHAEDALFRHRFPEKSFLDGCTNGLRLELMFPSCWNGKDISSPNHQSHVAYPSGVQDGFCPEGFPVRLPGLFFETIYDTQVFAGRNGRFVLANGDVDGYGYHGDFISGWEEPFLQQAVDTCTSLSGRIDDCPIFDLQSEADAHQCKLKNIPSALAGENVDRPSPFLPGNVAIVYADGTKEGGAGPFDDPKPTVDAVFKEAAVVTSSEPPPPPPSTTEPPPPPPPPPTTTAPPPPPPVEEPKEDPDAGKFASTQYVTVGDVVSKILWVEETAFVTAFMDVTSTTTITATATIANKAKRTEAAVLARHRHVHRHVHRHGRRAS